jgi:prephenate dehydrogenase
MLGKTVLQKMGDEKNIFDMAGSGFSSTVRLAKSSPDMWAPIFVENKENVLAALDGYIANLNAFRTQIAEEDVQGLKKEMREINVIRGILDFGK